MLAVLAVLMVVTAACAQDGQALSPITEAYRTQSTAERMEIEVLRGLARAARSEVVVAIRPGESPAVALALGDDDPLRILARPGQLLAWRQSDRSRVFTVVLPEPFGRRAIEAVLPPVLVPQIDLAFAASPSGLLAVMPDLSWSLVASGERDRYAGVAQGAALTLSVGGDHRLAAMEVQREGRVRARARIEAVAVNETWFDAPPLDGTIVGSLADLGRAPGPVRSGEPFGQAIGIDARGRATTLRAVAGETERVVVLLVDARMPEDRASLAGALAQADLSGLSAKLNVSVVILAVGDGPVASLFERVTRGDGPRVRAFAVDGPPEWVPSIGEGVAFAVHGPSWVLLSAHGVPLIEQIDTEGGTQGHGPHEASHAPRPLAQRLAQAVGEAGRGF